MTIKVILSKISNIFIILAIFFVIGLVLSLHIFFRTEEKTPKKAFFVSSGLLLFVFIAYYILAITTSTNKFKHEPIPDSYFVKEGYDDSVKT